MTDNIENLGNLSKAVFGYLQALSQFEETTDVDELYRHFRASQPDISISKSIVRAWVALHSGKELEGKSDEELETFT